MLNEGRASFRTSDFPFVDVSILAERESWRKEINRPIYHIHKWWATRLGSVFRPLVIRSLRSHGMSGMESFYERHDMKGKTVFDPFMGSGTTIGESIKLGAKAIGCDINPISTFLVRQWLQKVEKKDLIKTFEEIEKKISGEIDQFYRIRDPETGENIRVLYYFWVKVVTVGGEEIPLFTKYVFSQNAYPKKKPEAQIICPACWKIFEGTYDSKECTCPFCYHTFDPQNGPSKGQTVTDSGGRNHRILDLIPRDRPVRERMYAALAIRPSGKKVYLPIDTESVKLYERAENMLRELEGRLPLPQMKVRRGHNTNQAINYNYREWRDFFNDRQLLCLGLLLREITDLNDEILRDQFLCLFSSTLEYNNMFCTFKGEGTGAVRPIFSNHILKPEKTPLENSVWGSENSSGCFSTLFRSRLLKAKEYLDHPFEIKIEEGDTKKVICSGPIDVSVFGEWERFEKSENGVLILNGDSSSTDIPAGSVDAVVTDPPYFDFINYSELSDFFYSWLSPVMRKNNKEFERPDSSDEREVQSNDPLLFSDMLSGVLIECNRVMKPDAALTFSFHHSRPEGWAAVSYALVRAGFVLSSVYPIHSELRVSSVKSKTNEPISLDAILFCRKYAEEERVSDETDIITTAMKYTSELEGAGMKLSAADRTVISSALAMIHTTRKRYDFVSAKEFIRMMSEKTADGRYDKQDAEIFLHKPSHLGAGGVFSVEQSTNAVDRDPLDADRNGSEQYKMQYAAASGSEPSGPLPATHSPE